MEQKRLTYRDWSGDGQVRQDKFSEAISKLADYEDAEEQGRLIVFPVAIGGHLWMVDDYGIIRDLTVHELNVSSSGQTMLADSSGVRAYYSLSRIGETIFTTWDEVQAKRKEWEADNAENHETE